MKEPVSELYKRCSWQAKHKEEVSLFWNFQIDYLENQTSPKTTVTGVTHEQSAIRFEDQSHANMPFLISV